MDGKLAGFMGKAVAAAMSGSGSASGGSASGPAPAGAAGAKPSFVEQMVSKAVDKAMQNPELVKKVGGD